MISIFQAFLLALSIASPLGPVGVKAMKKALEQGFFSAVLVGLGALVVDTSFALLMWFGLSHLIHGSLFINIIWFVGSFVLIFLGIKTFRESFKKIKLAKKFNFSKASNSFLIGFIIDISNPVAILFWVGFYGLMMSPLSDYSSSLALINSFVVVLTWFGLLCLFSFFARKILKNKKVIKFFYMFAGVVLFSFGLFFLVRSILSFMKFF